MLYGYESDLHDTSMVDASTHAWKVTYVGRPEKGTATQFEDIQVDVVVSPCVR